MVVGSQLWVVGGGDREFRGLGFRLVAPRNPSCGCDHPRSHLSPRRSTPLRHVSEPFKIDNCPTFDRHFDSTSGNLHGKKWRLFRCLLASVCEAAPIKFTYHVFYAGHMLIDNEYKTEVSVLYQANTILICVECSERLRTMRAG